MALLEIAEATGVNQHFEQALQVTYGINCDWERTRTLVEIAEATGNSKLFGDELLHFISNVPIQHHKWEILDGLVKSMQAPDLFQMLQRWYQQEQESLSSQTKMRLFQRVTNQTLRVLEFPKNIQVLLQWAPFLPPSPEVAYPWFSALYCAFIQAQQTEYEASIQDYCSQLGLQASVAGIQEE